MRTVRAPADRAGHADGAAGYCARMQAVATSR